MKTGPSKNSFLYVLNDFDDLLKHENCLQKIGYHDGTNIEFSRNHEIIQYLKDAWQQLIIGDTGSAGSTYQGVELIRAMYGNSNIAVIDEKNLYAGERLASTINFHNHVQKSDRFITNIYPDLFTVDPKLETFENLFPKETFFSQKGGFGTLRSNEIKAANIEFSKKLFSPDINEYRENCLKGNLSDINIIKEVLKVLMLQKFLGQIHPKDDYKAILMIFVILRKLEYLSDVIKEIRFLFSKRHGSLNRGEIVRKLLLEDRSLIVINKKPKNYVSDPELIDKLYFFMIGEIFSLINFIFNNLQGDYLKKGNFPCIVFIDEGQKYFSIDDDFNQEKIKNMLLVL